MLNFLLKKIPFKVAQNPIGRQFFSLLPAHPLFYSSPYVRLSFHPSVCMSFCPSICPSVLPSIPLSVCLSICSSTHLSVCCLSSHHSVCCSVHPSFCPNVCSTKKGSKNCDNYQTVIYHIAVETPLLLPNLLLSCS